MTWVLVVVICVLFGATAFIVWRKWIAPWRQVEEVITQIGRLTRSVAHARLIGNR